MNNKQYICLALLVIALLNIPNYLFAKEESIIIDAPKYQEIDKLVLYYFPLDLETFSPICKEDLKNQYLFKIEVFQLAFAFSDVKSYLKDILDKHEFELANSSLDNYRAILEFWGEDRILYEYAVGYQSNVIEINGKIVKGDKAFYNLLKKVLPSFEAEKLYWVR